MHKFPSSFLALGTALLVAVLSLPAGAQTGRVEEQHTQPGPAEPYVPGLGDFMTAYVQPHHIKLWLAGKRENWRLAEYEAAELRETFEDVAKYHGSWNTVPVAQMVQTMVYPPLTAVDQAIKDHSEARFKQAYEGLTGTCNACHRASQHSFVVITVPAAGVFPDQRF